LPPLSDKCYIGGEKKGGCDMGGPTPQGSPEGWIKEILTETNEVKRSRLISDRSLEELALLEAWVVAESERDPSSKILREIQITIRLVRGLKNLPVIPELDISRLKRWR